MTMYPWDYDPQRFDEGGAEGASGTDSGEAAVGGESAAAEDGSSVETPDLDSEFEELVRDKYKSAYDKRVQTAIKSRFKAAAETKGQLEARDKVLSLAAKQFNVDTTSKTFLDDLTNAIENDHRLYERQAIDEGKTVEEIIEQQKLRRQADEYERIQQEKEAAESRNARFTQIHNEEIALKSLYPNLDVGKELENERFYDMVMNMNYDVKFAYQAVHAEEMTQSGMQFAASKAAKDTADAVSSRSRRPAENAAGTRGQTTPKVDPGKLSREEKDAYIKRAQRGESVSFV